MLHHCLHENLRNSNPCAAGARNQNSLVSKSSRFFTLCTKASQNTGKGRCSRSLNIIIKAQELISVFVEYLLGHITAEILELDEHVWPAMTRRLEEFVHQVIIRCTLHSRLLHSEVEFIFQKCFIVGTNIDHHRHDTMGSNTSGRTIQTEFSDGDSHSIGTQVAKTKDATAIGNNNDLHIPLRPVVHHGRHMSPILFTKVHPPRPPIPHGKLITSLTHRRSINNRRHLLHVIDQYAMI
mmetsp:Transcript_17/g.45  ORF Transcript_17/g.45 Transcript_17/m.45 type:complete len:238 (+) Transcript_17:782-1495(+)